MWSIRQALSSNLLTQLLGTKVLITHLAIVWHVHPIKSTLHQLNKKKKNWTYSSTIDQLSALKLYYISLHFLHKVKTMFSCDEEPDALWYFFLPSSYEIPTDFFLIYISLLEIKTIYELWDIVVWCVFVEMQNNQ